MIGQNLLPCCAPSPPPVSIGSSSKIKMIVECGTVFTQTLLTRHCRFGLYVFSFVPCNSPMFFQDSMFPITMSRSLPWIETQLASCAAKSSGIQIL